jgi:hypothetical protein
MLEDRRLAPLQGLMPTDFRRLAAGSRHNLAALRQAAHNQQPTAA